MNLKYLLVILCLCALLSVHYVDAKKKKKSTKQKVKETLKEHADSAVNGKVLEI
jgi:hypothetical protein